MGSRTWIKLYVEKWLTGTIREEPPEYRGLWTDLLTLAGSTLAGDAGKVEFLLGVGPSQVQLAEGFKVHIDLWTAFENRMVVTERITIDERRVITICNWSRYQGEYDRQKPYRQGKKKVTKSDEGELYGEREGEREREKKEKEITKRRRKPKGQRTQHDYPAVFEKVWNILGPLRPDHSKRKAFHAWQARKREGIEPDDLLKAAGHFAVAMGEREAQHVPHGSTFLGPSENWKPYVDGVPDLGGGEYDISTWQPPEVRNKK